jgi:hypothetical protein
MQNLARIALRPFALVIVALAALLSSAAATAQVGQLVGSPLTTKRFERLLRVYVDPTPEEAKALDGVHEAYLDRFRAELDPEIQALSRSTPTGMPSKEEFEKFLRDLERLEAKIAEADKAFFDSAAALVAPERRGGIERVRGARERQRELGGFSRMGSMMFGGGGSFVDLADLLSREQTVRLVPADLRPQFDAMLVEQERRTLAQAKAYGSSVRKSMSKIYDIMAEAQSAGLGDVDVPAGADADGANPEEVAAAAQAAQGRMAGMMQSLRALGEEPRKAVEANFTANRSAIRQFASVLPELEIYRLRAALSEKSVGMMGAMMMGGPGNPAGDVSAVIRRVRRDATIGPDVKAALAPIELDWRRERAEHSEKLADVALSIDMSAMMVGGDGGDPMAAMRPLQERAEQGEAIDRRAYAAVVALLGEEVSDRFVTKLESGNREGGTTYYPVSAPAEAESEGEAPSWEPSFTMMLDAPAPMAVRDVVAALRAVGVEPPAVEVLDAVVEAWKVREWDAKVAPIGRELGEARRLLYLPSEDGQARRSEAMSASMQSALRRIADAMIAADIALCADLATALDLNPNGAGLLLLRLERLRLATEGAYYGNERTIVSPLKLIASARMDGPTARAFIENTAASWDALASELPSLLKASVDRLTERDALQATLGERAEFERYTAMIARHSRASQELMDRVRSIHRAAVDAATDDPARRTAIWRGYLAVENPAVYQPADSALRQLDDAIALGDLSIDQRGRLDALRAEYEAAYLSLSEKIVEGSAGMVAGSDPDGWREYQERAEVVEKIRFERNERTEKARSEARRILGDELASRVRGLVPDEADPSAGRRATGFNPFLEDED